MQNVIEKPLGKAVKIRAEFAATSAVQSLADFSKITLEVGEENYATDTTPDKLYLKPDDDNVLILDIGADTELEKGAYAPKIIGYSATYTDGYPITTPDVPKIKPILVY